MDEDSQLNFPVIGTRPNRNSRDGLSTSLMYEDRQDVTGSHEGDEEHAAPAALLIILSVINLNCILVFLPINCRITSGFLQISTKNQPMFLFFVGVQFVCIADLVVCLIDVILLWIEVPDWVCAILGISSISIYCYLSFLIACICLYR